MKTEQKILLVEDDPDDQQLFIEALKETDASIGYLLAGDGQQAIDLLNKLEESLPCLIVMDLRMPKFGGEKCLAAIRDNNRFDNIPIIIYTTSRSITESQELLSMGAVHFMSKPNSEEDVYYQVSLMLEEYCSFNERKNQTKQGQDLDNLYPGSI